MNEKIINILYLYPRDMNIYGDGGNVLTIKRRLEWYGFIPNVIEYNPGDDFPVDADIIIGGGGQDSGQQKIQTDLHQIAPFLQELASLGTPMLVICGLYQLFGKFFKTSSGEIIKGIGIFDIETYAKSERLIGNITSYSEQFGEMIGYENHSGQTFLGKNMTALGRVRIGAGNNNEDDSEGARYKNVIGSYMHGSFLPKNPQVADFLIQTAVTKKYAMIIDSTIINNSICDQARKIALKRPR